jgi:RimJ/RimL family protein N-acetyltransferase
VSVDGGSITFRALHPDDCGKLVGWIPSSDALFQWSGPWDFRWPLHRAQLERDLAAAGERRRVLAAVNPAGELVGHVMLTAWPDHGLGLIGRVLVDPERRGSGLGRALMREIVRVGFDELGLHRLQLTVYDFNSAAIACYQHTGFTIEGRLRDSTLGSDGYWNGYVMAMLEPEYRRRQLPHDGGHVVRSARFGDAEALSRLLTELGYPQNADQARAALTAWAGDPRGTVLVAEVDGRPAGVIAAHCVPYLERPGSFARVVALAVDARHRRSGLGRRLLGAAEAWARELGCRDVEITCSRSRHDAPAFYETLGFAEECERSARFKRSLGDPAAERERTHLWAS